MAEGLKADMPYARSKTRANFFKPLKTIRIPEKPEITEIIALLRFATHRLGHHRTLTLESLFCRPFFGLVRFATFVAFCLLIMR